MDVSTNQARAHSELGQPTTSPTRLMEIAQQHPELGPQISAHPNAYPELIEWIDRYAAEAIAYHQRQTASHEAAQELTSDATPASTVPMATNPKTGWQKAEAVMDGVGRAANSVTSVVTMLYGIGLIIVGFVAFAAPTPGAPIIAIVLLAYGGYLAIPHRFAKWVIW